MFTCLLCKLLPCLIVIWNDEGLVKPIEIFLWKVWLLLEERRPCVATTSYGCRYKVYVMEVVYILLTFYKYDSTVILDVRPSVRNLLYAVPIPDILACYICT